MLLLQWLFTISQIRLVQYKYSTPALQNFNYYQATFEVLRDWIRELQKLGPSNIVLAIAGNKCDLEDSREVRHN